LIGLAAATGAMMGCSEEPSGTVSPVGFVETALPEDGAAPVRHGRRDGLVPLDVGDAWNYQGTFRLFDQVGGDSLVFDREETHTVVGTEHRFDREYKVVEVAIRESGPFGVDEFSQWMRRRQTRGGLYAADVPLNEPPVGVDAAAVSTPRVPMRLRAAPDGIRGPELERAWRELLARCEIVESMLARATVPSGRIAASAAENELTTLDYPLHRGASWQIRVDPEFSATVERIELVRTPARRVLAYRIRVDNEFLGPNDIVHVWYGPVGFVAQAYRLETEATDEYGNVIATLIAEDNLILVSSNVMRPRGKPHAGDDIGLLTEEPIR
jgi:hypothetical protein